MGDLKTRMTYHQALQCLKDNKDVIAKARYESETYSWGPSDQVLVPIKLLEALVIVSLENSKTVYLNVD